MSKFVMLSFERDVLSLFASRRVSCRHMMSKLPSSIACCMVLSFVFAPWQLKCKMLMSFILVLPVLPPTGAR